MKKSSYCLLLVVLLLITTVGIADSNVTIMLNGVRLVLLDKYGKLEQPIIQDGKVYVPLESFVDTIGGTYVYDELSLTATVSLNQQGDESHEKKKVSITSDNFETYFKVTCSLKDFKEKSQFNDMSLIGYESYTSQEGSCNVCLSIEPRQQFEIGDISFIYEANMVANPGDLYHSTVKIQGKLSNEGTYSGKAVYEWTISSPFHPNSCKAEMESGFITKASGFIIE